MDDTHAKEILQRYKRLAKLWEELIELDDMNWTSKNWKRYVNNWNKIKKEAKQQLKQVKYAKAGKKYET